MSLLPNGSSSNSDFQGGDPEVGCTRLQLHVCSRQPLLRDLTQQQEIIDLLKDSAEHSHPDRCGEQPHALARGGGVDRTQFGLRPAQRSLETRTSRWVKYLVGCFPSIY
jgi:hypothetical protein